MPKRVHSALPIDLLNLLGTFIGDDYHYLTFKLTPKGFLSHHRIFMQSRTNNKKTNHFLYTEDYEIKHRMGAGVLLVWYNFHVGRRRKWYQPRRWGLQLCVHERSIAEDDRIWELITSRYKTFLT